MTVESKTATIYGVGVALPANLLPAMDGVYCHWWREFYDAPGEMLVPERIVMPHIEGEPLMAGESFAFASLESLRGFVAETTARLAPLNVWFDVRVMPRPLED